MAGLYIHIPFCKTRCGYCDFHTSTGFTMMEPLIQAIAQEITVNKRYVKGEKIETIYFGGGTPSLLPDHLLQYLFETIYGELDVLDGAEVTLEANPDDLNEDKLRQLRNMPVNRLSIGVQSLINSELRLMNRRHSSVQAINAIERAYRFGFENLTIDLIYGIPNQTFEGWEHTLKTALKLPVKHLSSYSLTYEKNTPFFNMVQNKKLTPLDDKKVLQLYKMLLNETESAGFNHYEISNFAKPGFHSKHNSSYWNGAVYWGVGPSAHSYNRTSRQWNVSDNITYINALKNGSNCFEMESLDENTRYNDYVVTRMRTMHGCDLDEITALFGNNKTDWFLKNANKFLISDALLRQGNVIRLSKDGVFISDHIMSELLYA